HLQLPAELQSNAPPTSPVSGYFRGAFEMNPATTAIQGFAFDFSISGSSIPLLNGTAQTGPWTYYRDGSRPVTGNIDAATGQFSLSVPTAFWSPNLQLANPAPAPQAAGALDGLPIPFTETVSGSFGPLAQLAAAMDNCPATSNPEQADSDGDGLGDACEGF